MEYNAKKNYTIFVDRLRIGLRVLLHTSKPFNAIGDEYVSSQRLYTTLFDTDGFAAPLFTGNRIGTIVLNDTKK